ncbi:TerC family protein [Latilactobacillus graminis]|uniref:TerC family protein n=1 Tax=Latilactobacillus graminis TaxID=60519 RepID=A0ABX6C7S3_9LACO|nr:TerC family protein [Latilactobacillus graminis]QFP79044.1 TerC family protein [Latilactobacillus graminis]
MNWIIQLYQPFFELSNWQTVITSSEDWLLILTLVIMECLLSVDNAVVLAAQTQTLPTKIEQEKSLVYGLWGAYLFRFIIIGVGTFLIHLWEIKVAGSLYLIYLVIAYFRKNGQPKSAKKTAAGTKISSPHHFWRTVASIELMDIVFSIDSVLASLAISNNPVIVLIGGMIGIICMRGIAQLIAQLMKKIPELNPMAYILILFIAVKLFLSIPAIYYEIPNLVFAGVVFGVIILTLIIHYVRTARAK